MNERDSSGGALTGATGDLTRDEIQRDLVTGERREVSDPERQADVTQAQTARADATTGSAQPRGRGAGGDDVSDHEEHY
ncbi:MAG TPA: hypothetical protein VMP86_02665 [Candidatus Binatia bacterium]|nr:hypothetical protein [Candidatus Binatia bacterium]